MDRTVVDRISRFVGMSAISDYNSVAWRAKAYRFPLAWFLAKVQIGAYKG
jgi:hypothetical protein